MSYDNPRRWVYSFGEHDFGAGSESLSLKGPSGKKGVLREIQVNATETFTDDTTSGNVQVGTAADPDAYGLLDLGTTADTNTASYAAGDDADAVISESIPADTQVEVTFTAPTGGTPAGKGFVQIVIDWDW